MSEWKRTTNEIPLAGLPAGMLSAIDEHVERHNLGPILSDALMCVQTDSEKVKKGLFGGTETMQMGAVITPRWLVWAVSGTTRNIQAAVLSAQLAQITVQDYAQTPFARLIPDAGLQVSGMFTDGGENASAFIGLEECPTGKRFKDLVIRAAQDAKK